MDFKSGIFYSQRAQGAVSNNGWAFIGHVAASEKYELLNFLNGCAEMIGHCGLRGEIYFFHFMMPFHFVLSNFLYSFIMFLLPCSRGGKLSLLAFKLNS